MPDELVRALGCCIEGGCKHCPRFKNWRMDAWTCRYELMKDLYAALKERLGDA